MDYILDFRRCILLLAALFQRNEFDLESAARQFGRPEVLVSLASQMSSVPSLDVVQARVRPRLLTTDLRKLYLMGLLNRRKEERIVTGPSGKKYKSGVKFRYRLSKQGISYVGYLVNSNQSQGIKWKDLGELVAFATIQKEAPEYAQEALWQLHRKWNRTKGERRFPHRQNIYDYGMESFDPKLKGQILKSEALTATMKLTPVVGEMIAENPIIEKVIRAKAANETGPQAPQAEATHPRLDSAERTGDERPGHKASSPEAADDAAERLEILRQMRNDLLVVARQADEQSKPDSLSMKRGLEAEGYTVEYPKPQWALWDEASKKVAEDFTKRREEAAKKQKSEDDFLESLEMFWPLIMAAVHEGAAYAAKSLLQRRPDDLSHEPQDDAPPAPGSIPGNSSGGDPKSAVVEDTRRPKFRSMEP